jgi:hypothetical protein
MLHGPFAKGASHSVSHRQCFSCWGCGIQLALRFPLSTRSFEDVEKEACFILGLLAVKPDFQQRIASAGALTGLVRHGSL